MKPPLDTGDMEYRFERFCLVPAKQLLLLDGAPVALGTRALDLLTLLVQHPGQLVSKRDLIQFAWPTTVVHESNLKVNMASLRRVLSQGADSQFIATVPNRGYRFVADVSAVSVIGPRLPTGLSAGASSMPDRASLIGRARHLDLVAAMATAHRFVTLTGPGGVGKTTLALAVAHRIAETDDIPTSMVDFSTIHAPQLVPAAIALALGVRADLSDPFVGVVESLRPRKTVLVFDNCEHLVHAISVAAQRILSQTARVTILATSREPLRATLEHVYPLPALEWPFKPSGITTQQAMRYSAVELFVVRAKERGEFELTDENAQAVCDICRHLDGIALAIELVAPKVITLSPAVLLEQLERSFDLLAHGPRTAPARQQTVMATLEWSYRLLSDDEARLLRLLSVFTGVFEQFDVLSVAEGIGLPPRDVVTALDNLVSKSLVSSDLLSNALRYRLLEATRTFAADRLEREAEHELVMQRFAEHVLASLERAGADWQWQLTSDWVARYAWKIDDVRKALAWSFASDADPVVGVRLTAAALPLWDELSSVAESRARVDRALSVALAANFDEPSVLVPLLAAKAWGMTFAQRLVAETEAAWRQCLELAQTAHDTEQQLRALWGLAVYEVFTGQHRASAKTLEEFKQLVAAEGDWSALPDGERLSATVDMYRGEVRLALRRLTRLSQQHGRSERRSRAARFQLDRHVAIQNSLAFALWLTGSPEQAAAAAEDAVDRAVEIGHVVSHANALALAAIPISLLNGNVHSSQHHLDTLQHLLARHDIAIWGPLFRLYSGALNCMKGEPAGVEEFKSGLLEILDSRFVIRAPIYLTTLAAAKLIDGLTDEAEIHLQAAFDRIELQDERWCLPEALRIRGLVLAKQGLESEAEASLRTSLAESTSMGARAFELRAATSLAQLLIDAGRRQAAEELLAPVYASFSEGFETQDMVAARDLIDRLGSTHGAAVTIE